MTDGKPDHSLLLLLVRAAAAFRADLDVALASDPGVPEVLRGLHGGQRRLLTMIPPSGARGTDLAARTGITKQALGEFAAGLARAGLLTAEVDPSDRRARLWRLTPDGERAAAAGRQALESVAAEWRTALGDRDYERLIRSLDGVLARRSDNQHSVT